MLRIHGHNKKEQSVFIPLIVSEFLPDGPQNDELIRKHSEVGNRILKLENDLAEYNEELKTLWDRERNEFEKTIKDDSPEGTEAIDNIVLDGVASLLYSAESDEKRQLDEKYQEALKWRGPLVRGIAGRTRGFVFKVYSHDHDKHFHVVHRERGVDARFSFPDIKLINYKNSRNIIGSKEVKYIQSFFKDLENFKKLENEFKKRDEN